jgi:hypothetical protein
MFLLRLVVLEKEETMTLSPPSSLEGRYGKLLAKTSLFSLTLQTKEKGHARHFATLEA